MEVSVLPRFDNRNGWLEILGPRGPARRAHGSIEADFAVVGAGYTGLAAARRLAELRPGDAIVLLDAGRIGNNAAGRCSGFAIDQAHNIRARHFAGALDAEQRQIRLNRAGQAYLREAVDTHGIDCDWRDEGKIHGAATGRGAGLLATYSKNLDLLGAEYRWMDAGEMAERLGTRFYTRGLFTPGTILIQPAALVRGLAETLPGNVTVYEDSPVEAVDYGPPHRLRTPEAEIAATTLVLANNGFGAGFGFYDHHMIPLCTYGSLTRRLTADEVAALGGVESWGIIPADPFGTSVRRTCVDRILIRNIYAYSRRLETDGARLDWARRVHRRSFQNRFPMLPEVGFEYTWGGMLALSRNGEPVFGELRAGVHASICHNGVGISRGTICGKLLAEHIAGEESDLLAIMRGAGRPNRNYPEPFMGWGVAANLAWRRRGAGLEL